MNKLTLASFLAFAILSAGCGSPAGYVDRGNKLFDDGKYADAEINYLKAIQQNPKLGEAYFRLGTVQLRTSRPEQAYNNLLTAVRLLPGRHDAAVSLADAAFAAYLRNPRSRLYYDQIQKSASSFLKQDPQSFDGLRLEGYIEMLERHYPKAIELLKSADSVKPNQEDLVLALVQCLIEAHQEAEAEKRGRDLIQTQKTFAPIYEVLYRLYMNQERKGDAEAILKLKIANDPKNAGNRLELASHYAATGNEAGLKETIRQLEDQNRSADTGLEVGEFYTALNRPEDAIREYQAAATSYPDNKAAYERRIAQIYMGQGKKDQAAKLLDEILRSHRDDYDAREMRASLDVDSGDPQKLSTGTSRLETLAKEKPTDATVRFNLGKANLQSGNAREALVRFREAIQLEPDLAEAKLFAADASIRTGDYQQAMQYADQVLQRAPNNPVAQMMRVKSMAAMGRMSQALAETSQLAKTFPNQVAPRLELASLQLQEKNFTAAESMYRALFTENRKDLAALQGLIDSLYLQNRYDNAIEILKQELAKNDSPQLRAMLADAALRGRKLDIAVPAYTALAAANPGSSFFHVKLGDALLQKGSLQEAIAQFETAKKLAPKDAMVNSMLALGLKQAGRVNEARQAYREALSADPENPVLMNNLAYLIAETGGNLDDALQLAQDASRRRPGSTALLDTLGWIYLRKKMPDDAIRVLSDIVRKDPGQPVFRYHLAAALLQKGEKPEARKQLEAALADGPASADAVKINGLLAEAR